MSALAVSTGPMNEAVNGVAFSRLAALVGRGYRPRLRQVCVDQGHACIAFTHPREGHKRCPVPSITLWSDGIIATNGLLWPEKHVPSDELPPDWQRFIMPEDEKRFQGFIGSVATPGLVDVALKPIWVQTRVFIVRMMFGATLCTLISFPIKLLTNHL